MLPLARSLALNRDGPQTLLVHGSAVACGSRTQAASDKGGSTVSQQRGARHFKRTSLQLYPVWSILMVCSPQSAEVSYVQLKCRRSPMSATDILSTDTVMLSRARGHHSGAATLSSGVDGCPAPNCMSLSGECSGPGASRLRLRSPSSSWTTLASDARRRRKPARTSPLQCWRWRLRPVPIA